MDKLEELEEGEKRLKAELNAIRLAIRAEQLRIIGEIFGVYVGSIVKSDGREYSISDIYPWDDGDYLRTVKPVIKGHQILNEGTFKAVGKWLDDDWELVKEADGDNHGLHRMQ